MDANVRTGPWGRASLRLIAAALSLIALCAVLAAPAAADSFDTRLARARSDRARALAELHRTELRIAALRSDVARTGAALELAARDVVIADRARLALEARLDQARQAFNQRAAAIYEAGPGLRLELLLASRSWADVNAVQEFANRSLTVSGDVMAELGAEKAALQRTVATLERRRADLRAAAGRLQSLTGQLNQQLAQARTEARRAGQAVGALEREQRRIAATLAKQREDLGQAIDPSRGTDQSELLALLGPNEGRGCAIPSGLRLTTVHLSGVSSWYGPGFAGRPTASGAIYDPSLFTAANKELPLNTFLRVHFQGRCAVVLVNDRGPYIPGRTFDLSQGAANYLGLGLGFVTADLLVPN